MKKLLLVLLFALPSFVFSQEKEQAKEQAKDFEEKVVIKEISISFYTNLSNPSSFGLSTEGKAKSKFIKNGLSSNVMYFNYASASLDDIGPEESIVGTGLEFGIGERNYFGKNKNTGWYAENFFTYGYVKFNEPFFSGKYSYFSPINTDFGYKAKIVKVINFEVNGGFIWKWEIKGKGDVDNKMFDNLTPKIGLKIGYIF